MWSIRGQSPPPQSPPHIPLSRWLELTEDKIRAIFLAYIKFRRMSGVLNELMETEKDSTEPLVPDMARAMLLHRRVRDALDLQYKKLHVMMGWVNLVFRFRYRLFQVRYDGRWSTNQPVTD